MMLTFLRAGLLSAFLLLQGSANADTPRTWAYMSWWLPDSWRGAPVEQLDRMLFFELTVKENGQITERHGWPEQWGEFRAAMKKQGVPVDLTLTLFEPTAFDALFTSAEATQRLLQEASSLANHEDVAGLHLDFEVYNTVPTATLEGFRHFVRELSKRLRQRTPAKHLSVFFPMGGATALYDAATLALVDQAVFQGYDSHWKGSPAAGPLAPLRGDEAVTWEKALAKGLELGVPRNKLMLSFPLYGYEWQVKGAKPRSPTASEGVTTSFSPLPAGLVPAIQINVRDRVRTFGASHDPVSGSSHYHLRKPNGQFFEGWFEDWWSLNRKTDFVKQEQLAGLAFFVLGYDDNELLRHYLRLIAPP